MEPTDAGKPVGIIVEEILPPRIEDAGLEDCALPIDSIHEAFLKAATAVGSRFAHDDEDDDEAEPPVESTDRADNPIPENLKVNEVPVESKFSAEDREGGQSGTRMDCKSNQRGCNIGN